MKKNTVALILIIFSFQLQTTGCARRKRRSRYISRRRSIISKFKSVRYADFDKYHIPKQITFNENIRSENPKDPVLVLLWENARDAYYIIDRLENMPNYYKLFNKYYRKSSSSSGKYRKMDKKGQVKKTVILKGKGYRKWITAKKMGYKKMRQLATAVHEECHVYTDKFPLKLIYERYKSKTPLLYRTKTNPKRYRYAQYYAFYLNRRKTLLLRLRKVFCSSEIIYLIPAKFKKSRYRVYIEGKGFYKNNSTQVNGIYGLLDEYNAYYWTMKVMLGYYNYFKKKGLNRKNLYMFERLLISDYKPWFEFRYYILTYLIHAKRKHPKVYKALMNDKQLRNIFTAIDDNFFSLYKKLNNAIKSFELYARKRKLKNLIYFNSICNDYIKTMQSRQYAKIAHSFRTHTPKYSFEQCHYH